jgi:perosamine synthetase
MNLFRASVRFGLRRIHDVIEYLRGTPLNTVSLGSMTLNQDDVRIAREWLRNRTLWSDGRIVKKYETEFARWNGSKRAFAFMGGRVALSACIYALDLRPGDEVILPGYSCVVVSNAFHYAGIKPVYCDIELETFGLDGAALSAKISRKTRAILLHHLYGIVCRDYHAILETAKRQGLFVIEDCCQSTGAEYKGRKVGNWGDVAFYSSEQSKVFNTIQGGLAIAKNEMFAGRLETYYSESVWPDEVWIEKQLYNVILDYYGQKHSQRWWLRDIVNRLYGDKRLISTTSGETKGICPGHYRRRMPPAIAILGLNQLRKIDRYNALRRETAKRWQSWCRERGYGSPLVAPESVPVYLRYPVLVEPEKKRDTRWAREELGIDLGVWFVSHLHPAPERIEGCPNADVAVKQCVNFPCLT